MFFKFPLHQITFMRSGYMNINKFSFKLLFLAMLSFTVKSNFAQERKFELYGYGQVEYQASDKKNSLNGFNQRRVNLIGEYFIDQNIRVLTDVEYEGSAELNSTDSIYTGGIKVSRMWIEYTINPMLNFKAGKMLAPFGLYNLIHDASASYYPVDAPIMYSRFNFFPGIRAQRLISKYNTGVSVFGTFNLNNYGSQLEYDLGVSNGRGALPDGTDANQNKAVFGRLMYRPSLLTGLQIGTSYYADKNLNGIGGIVNDFETNFGVDVQYENNSVQIQAETMFSSFTNPLSVRQKTEVYYLQAAYTLWDVLTPFFNFTSVLPDFKKTENTYSRWNAGLNYAISPNLYLKSEIQFHSLEEDKNEGSFVVFKSSLAVAF